MATVYVRTPQHVDVFMPQGGLPTITKAGVAVDDTTQLPGLKVAAALSRITLEVSTTAYPAARGQLRYDATNPGRWPWTA